MAVGPALTQGDIVFPLNKVTNSIGRKDRITNLVPDVDLATYDQERAVSRKHAEATYDAGRILLRDLGSTNGTTVNGEPLQLQVDRELVDGDRVSLGGYEVAFAASHPWPEGVEPEWPAEAPVGLETVVSSAEETAVMRPDETAVIPPGGLAGAEPATEGELAGAEDVYAPAPTEADGAPGEEAAATAEPGAVAEDASVATVADPVPVDFQAAPPDAPVSAEGSLSFIPCTNHPHLPAVGLCPGCLDPFCIDCLPERPGLPLACNRCAGIQARLGVVATEVAPAMAGGYPAPAGGGFPPPPDAPPAYAPPPAPEAAPEEKKKKWPF
jgi:hypothetical protein